MLPQLILLTHGKPNRVYATALISNTVYTSIVIS
jgi:hypothetical protein